MEKLSNPEAGMTSFEGESNVMPFDLGFSKSETGVAQMDSCVAHSEVGAAHFPLVVVESPFQTSLFFRGRWLASGFAFSSKKQGFMLLIRHVCVSQLLRHHPRHV